MLGKERTWKLPYSLGSSSSDSAGLGGSIVHGKWSRLLGWDPGICESRPCEKAWQACHHFAGVCVSGMLKVPGGGGKEGLCWGERTGSYITHFLPKA